MPRLITEQGRTSPLVLTVNIVCAILAIAVIIISSSIIAIYMIYMQKMPYVKVSYACLNKLSYDQLWYLDIEMNLIIVAKNDNKRVHANFYDENFILRFHGKDIAELRAGPLNVPKNSSFVLNYIVRSSRIPLDNGPTEAMDEAPSKGVVSFSLDGQARTQWRAGKFLSKRMWTHLSCPLQFFLANGSSVNLDCTSKPH